MTTYLQTISEAAFESLKPSYENELDKLKTLNEAWGHVEKEYRLEKNDKSDEGESNNGGVEGDKKKVTNPFKTLMGQLFGWLQQLLVIGFNSGKYDINVIKRFFVPYLLTPSEDEDESDESDESCFAIKRLNTFMCFSTNRLRFLDFLIIFFSFSNAYYLTFRAIYGTYVDLPYWRPE